jgi:hypothetical protein
VATSLRAWSCAVIVACFRPSPATDVPCSGDGECPTGQICDTRQSPPTCVVTLADASPADARALVPAVVLMSGSAGDGSSAFTTLEVALGAPASGDLLVVAIADFDGIAVASVVDSTGHALTAAGARAVMSGTSSELWYEVGATAATSVTVNMSHPSNFDVWVVDVSGVHAGPPAQVAEACLEYPPSIVTAPIATTEANEVIVSVTMLAAPLDVGDVKPPFTGLFPFNGNDTAVLVAAIPGTYATAFDLLHGSGSAAMTCASTAAWLPGP